MDFLKGEFTLPEITWNVFHVTITANKIHSTLYLILTCNCKKEFSTNRVQSVYALFMDRVRPLERNCYSRTSLCSLPDGLFMMDNHIDHHAFRSFPFDHNSCAKARGRYLADKRCFSKKVASERCDIIQFRDWLRFAWTEGKKSNKNSNKYSKRPFCRYRLGPTLYLWKYEWQ